MQRGSLTELQPAVNKEEEERIREEKEKKRDLKFKHGHCNNDINKRKCETYGGADIEESVVAMINGHNSHRPRWNIAKHKYTTCISVDRTERRLKYKKIDTFK